MYVYVFTSKAHSAATNRYGANIKLHLIHVQYLQATTRKISYIDRKVMGTLLAFYLNFKFEKCFVDVMQIEKSTGEKKTLFAADFPRISRIKTIGFPSLVSEPILDILKRLV